MLTKRWCRCVLSGAVIGIRYLSRRATTKPVSRIGTASTSSGKNRATVAAVFSSPSTETAASEKPSSIAPESPMKMRAGKKLWRRKPRVAPKTIAVKAAAVGLPSESSIAVKASAAIAQTPAASPSRPSRKLTMFITATIQSTVSGPPTHGERS